MVDNASDDGTADLVESEFPARSWSDRMRPRLRRGQQPRARGARGDAVCFLNPDTEAAPGSLARLCRTLRSDSTAAVVAPSCSTPTAPTSALPAGSRGWRRPWSVVAPLSAGSGRPTRGRAATSPSIFAGTARTRSTGCPGPAWSCTARRRSTAVGSTPASSCTGRTPTGAAVSPGPGGACSAIRPPWWCTTKGPPSVSRCARWSPSTAAPTGYAAKHHLSGPARLLRPAAAGALAARAGLVLARRAVAGLGPHRLGPHRPGPHRPGSGHRPGLGHQPRLWPPALPLSPGSLIASTATIPQ